MNFLLYVAGTLAGLILFGIGFIGLSGMPVKPVSHLTILLEPTGLSEVVDTLYLQAFVVLGVWLLLSYWVRLAAFCAIIVILSKILLLHGWLPMTLTSGLCLLLSAVIAARVKKPT